MLHFQGLFGIFQTLNEIWFLNNTPEAQQQLKIVPEKFVPKETKVEEFTTYETIARTITYSKELEHFYLEGVKKLLKSWTIYMEILRRIR